MHKTSHSTRCLLAATRREDIAFQMLFSIWHGDVNTLNMVFRMRLSLLWLMIFILGISIYSIGRMDYLLRMCDQTSYRRTRVQNPQGFRASVTQSAGRPRKQVLIGVMTAAAFVDSRVAAIWRTWAKTINGDVLFFSSQNTSTRRDMPVLPLPAVDDTYPPTKKSFMMIKFLHDYGIDKYDFFMRVDDDTYINGRRLSEFLGRLNSSDRLYIGQPGFGEGNEENNLYLEKAFCMGGSSIIFSPIIFKRIGPRLDACLQRLLVNHEDVEIARCISRLAGISCTQSYEVTELFYHSYSYMTDQTAFPHTLTVPQMDSAIAFHPLKGRSHQYSVHNVIMSKEKAVLELNIVQEKRAISRMNHFLSESSLLQRDLPPKPRSVEDIATWNFVTYNKQKALHNTFALRYVMESPWKHQLEQVLNRLTRIYSINVTGNHTVEQEAVKSIFFGFSRVNPDLGIEYLLSALIEYKRELGVPWKKPETRQFKLQSTFTPVVIREIVKPSQEDLYIIVPLSQRFEQFERFIKNFEEVCLIETNNCRLILVLSESESAKQTIDLIKRSPAENRIIIEKMDSRFSRAPALHLGVTSLQHNDALMFFLDVDVHFTAASLQRVRLHTAAGKQAYFPVVFSQYDNRVVCGGRVCSLQSLKENAGNYRFHGYGIVSLYKTDYFACGGFNVTIFGWGKEDVDLFEKVMKRMNIFRAADPDLVHIFHPIECESELTAEQTKMCYNSRAGSLSSQDNFAKRYFNSTHLKTRSTTILNTLYQATTVHSVTTTPVLKTTTRGSQTTAAVSTKLAIITQVRTAATVATQKRTTATVTTQKRVSPQQNAVLNAKFLLTQPSAPSTRSILKSQANAQQGSVALNKVTQLLPQTTLSNRSQTQTLPTAAAFSKKKIT